MEIRSPYSACTALRERLPRFSAAARSMAAMGGARTSCICEIPPQDPPWGRSLRSPGRDPCCKAIILVSPFVLDPQLRETASSSRSTTKAGRSSAPDTSAVG